MIKLVAFDWNGTLLSDTKPTWEASNLVFKRYGKPPISLAQFRNSFAIPIVDFYTANGWTRAQFLKFSTQQSLTYHRLYEERVKTARSRAGARELLTWLQKHNIKSVIYSNHTQQEVITHCKRLKIFHFFDAILARMTVDEHNLKRTKEGRLVSYLSVNRIKPANALTVGDTCEEIDIAHGLGMKAAAITNGWNSETKLKSSKPHYLIHNLTSLIKIIRQLNHEPAKN